MIKLTTSSRTKLGAKNALIKKEGIYLPAGFLRSRPELTSSKWCAFINDDGCLVLKKAFRGARIAAQKHAGIISCAAPQSAHGVYVLIEETEDGLIFKKEESPA
jgi:hypothetical protein